MIETEIMMRQIGYLDSIEYQNSQYKIDQVQPTLYKTTTEWKQIVKQCSDDILTKEEKIVTLLQYPN